MAGEVWWKRKTAQAGASIDAAPLPAREETPSSFLGRVGALPSWVKVALGVLLFLAIWYGVIGTLRAGVEPDLALRPTPAQLPAGGSVTVAMAARLLDREVNERAFTPNDPILFPTGLARRTPAYQSRLIETIAVAVAALADQSGASELTRAASELATPPDQRRLRAGWPPVGAPAERHYRKAQKALVAHNVALAASKTNIADTQGPAKIDAASAAALAALAEAVEAQAASGDRLIRGADTGNASVQLSGARGTATAAALLLRGLRDDNAAAIRLSGRAARWGEALDALDAAAKVSPLVTRNSDLVTIGYSLLIAGNAMRDILEGVP